MIVYFVKHVPQSYFFLFLLKVMYNRNDSNYNYKITYILHANN